MTLDNIVESDVDPCTPPPRHRSIPHLSDKDYEDSKWQAVDNEEEGSNLEANYVSAATVHRTDLPFKRRRFRNVAFPKERHDRESDQSEAEHGFH